MIPTISPLPPLLLLLCLCAAPSTSLQQQWPPPGSCAAVAAAERIDCGYVGIAEASCLARGCCFSSSGSTFHQCYRPANTSQPPADWAPQIAAADMLFTVNHVATYNSSHVGNGFMSYVIGPPCNDTLCAMGGISSQLGDDQTSLGGLFLAGVFNGISNSTPSHRARLAAVHNYYLDLPVAPLANSNTSLFYTGSALDMRNGLFYNRTALYTPSCTAHIEQRWYAHRTIHNLLVHELEVLSVEVHDESAAAGCVVALRPWHLPWEQMTDFELTLGSNGGLATVQGCTQLAEVPGYVNVSCVGLAYTPLPDNITLNQPITMRFMLAAHSSVELPGWTPDQLVAAAVANYSVIAQQNTSALRASHEAAWAELWDAGLEVGGDRTVAAAFNSTLYYILSAVRANQPYGLSPGGLCSNSYDGRSFWDTETWMFPVLSLLHPDIGTSLLEYRRARLHPAQLHAQWLGYQGAMYPWTSTLTGFGTTNDAIDFDDNEQHITADIGLALQVFYLNHLSQWPAATSSFLGAYWPMLNATCAFWSSRFQPITPPGSTVANYTVKHVMGPDESAGIVDDDAYTNGAAAALLRFCVQVAPAAGQTVPSIWSAQGARPYLPLNASLYIRPVHSQYTGYAGASIAQAAVALLQYPLGYVFDRQQMIDDLAYYESVTRAGDFFTGDSTYSIAWLALGNATAALKQWAAAFAHMDTLNFNVWHETTGRGHSNFITGGGGFLQNLVYGWVGFRAGQPVPQQPGATQLVLRPVFPPNITLIRLRRICYQQMALDITFVQQPPSTTVVRRMDPMNCATWMDADRSAASILLVQADGGSWTRLLTGQNITLPAAQEVGVWVFPGM